MAFQKDIFISYAHYDNQQVDQNFESWVSDFHETLYRYVKEKWGKDPEIWRDNQLHGNDNFKDEILAQIPSVKILISVITPRYVNSDWCKDEVQAFLDAAVHNGGLEIGHKSRIFKILKTPVEREAEPEPIRRNPGYEFYKINPASNEKLEFKKEFGEEYRNLYYLGINRVSEDIVKILKRLNNSSDAQAAFRGNIYLAETSDDLQEDWNHIKDELEDKGYTVFPNKNLPHAGDRFISEVEGYLGNCTLSVHLVSYDDYGFIPSKSTKSIIELQIESAAKYSARDKLDRLIWLVPKTKIAATTDGAAPVQNNGELVSRLQEREDLHGFSDLLEVEDLQVFKKAIFDTIDKRTARNASLAEQARLAATPAPIQVTASSPTYSGDPKVVFLMCDQRDLEDSLPLRNYLDQDAGFEVRIPTFKDDGMKEQEDNLSSCDALVIYYGNGTQDCVISKLNALNKIKMLRPAPFLAKMLYMAGPETAEKATFTTKQCIVKRAGGSFNPELLKEFMALLNPPAK
jgi:hypothetical protein